MRKNDIWEVLGNVAMVVTIILSVLVLAVCTTGCTTRRVNSPSPVNHIPNFVTMGHATGLF